MAKLTAKEIVASMKEMTILEVNDLLDLMKEELGVDPSAVAVAPVASTEAKSDEPSVVNVVLTAAGDNKLSVIKLIKEVTGLGLGDSKAIADNGGVIKEKVAAAEAEEMKAKFVEAGATI